MVVLLKMAASLIFVLIYSSLTFSTVIAQNQSSSSIQECGIITPVTSLVLTSYNEGLPWHATFYRKNRNPYIQVCNGALISTNKIISVAHCFWDRQQKLLHPADQYAVAVGNLYRQYNDTRDINSQKSNVVDIKIPPLFKGSATNSQDDIAIVVVETPFAYHLSVRPVCLDFDQNFEKKQLSDGNRGKAASWYNGVTKRQSSVMNILNLPYLSMEHCFEMSSPSFRPYLTHDKFCVGPDNGKLLCLGDTGSGLAFPESYRDTERYYLRGVISGSPANDDHDCVTFNAFTSIVKHEDFIKQYL